MGDQGVSARFERRGAAAREAVAPLRARRVVAVQGSGAGGGWRRILPGLGPAASLAAAGLAVAALVGCGLLDDDQDLPDVARVEITGTAPADLEMVVSDDFYRVNDFEQGGQRNVLVYADTSFIRPDFSKDYDIQVAQRFFVRLTNHASDVASIVLSVAFDGQVSYTQRANISEGGSLEFSEIFFGT